MHIVLFEKCKLFFIINVYILRVYFFGIPEASNIGQYNYSDPFCILGPRLLPKENKYDVAW